MSHLKLGALDGDDLAVISAHMQDAVMRVGDMKYLPKKQRFVILANRFNWDGAQTPEEGYQRRRTGLHFNRIGSVRSSRIRNSAEESIVSLLNIEFRESEAPSGTIRLNFAGGGIIELEAECVDAWLSDLGPEWGTGRMPEHDLEREAD
ncbi:MAG: DUF2948 family protein [Pseudomonadota bacterium]